MPMWPGTLSRSRRKSPAPWSQSARTTPTACRRARCSCASIRPTRRSHWGRRRRSLRRLCARCARCTRGMPRSKRRRRSARASLRKPTKILRGAARWPAPAPFPKRMSSMRATRSRPRGRRSRRRAKTWSRIASAPKARRWRSIRAWPRRRRACATLSSRCRGPRSPRPVAGYVARRTVQVGQRVAPGALMMAVVPLDSVWVDANFKEVQLRDMRIGQPVKLTRRPLRQPHRIPRQGRGPLCRHRRGFRAAAAAERDRQLDQGRAAPAGAHCARPGAARCPPAAGRPFDARRSGYSRHWRRAACAAPRANPVWAPAVFAKPGGRRGGARAGDHRGQPGHGAAKVNRG